MRVDISDKTSSLAAFDAFLPFYSIAHHDVAQYLPIHYSAY